jgi:hypothetical protein
MDAGVFYRAGSVSGNCREVLCGTQGTTFAATLRGEAVPTAIIIAGPSLALPRQHSRVLTNIRDDRMRWQSARCACETPRATRRAARRGSRDRRAFTWPWNWMSSQSNLVQSTAQATVARRGAGSPPSTNRRDSCGQLFTRLEGTRQRRAARDVSF